MFDPFCCSPGARYHIVSFPVVLESLILTFASFALDFAPLVNATTKYKASGHVNVQEKMTVLQTLPRYAIRATKRTIILKWIK